MAIVFIRTPSPDVVTSNKARLNAIQKWLEVKKASGDDAKALGNLCTKDYSPRSVVRLLNIASIVPKDKLAN